MNALHAGRVKTRPIFDRPCFVLASIPCGEGVPHDELKCKLVSVSAEAISQGPWQNAKGVVIAKSVAELHGATNNLTKDSRHMNLWNLSHGTRGFGMETLKLTGGAGLIYCFIAI